MALNIIRIRKWNLIKHSPTLRRISYSINKIKYTTLGRVYILTFMILNKQHQSASNHAAEESSWHIVPVNLLAIYYWNIPLYALSSCPINLSPAFRVRYIIASGENLERYFYNRHLRRHGSITRYAYFNPLTMTSAIYIWR